MSQLFSIFLIVFFTSSAQAQSLSELFNSAKKQTAAIKERVWAVEIAKEQKDKVIATALPSVTAQSNNVWREQANVGPFGEAYQHTAFINLTQPLFQGGSEYYSIAAARNLPEIAEYEKKQEELRIFALVAQSFYQSLRFQNELQVYGEQEQTLKDRLQTLKKRAKIGRSKTTDVLAARTQLARIISERSRVERSLVASNRNLKNLTGLQNIELLVDSQDVSNLQLHPEWDRQVEDNPQIKANELLLQTAEKERKAAQGSFLPSVDADANYYLDRAGILQESSWDVTVVAKWNLFNGGSDASEVRIQRLQAAQIEARLQDIKRTLNNDFQSLKKEFYLHQKTLRQLDEAVGLARSNYKQHLKEANRGLVSDLEALQVLEDYLQIRRSHFQQVFEAKMAYVQLQALAGELP